MSSTLSLRASLLSVRDALGAYGGMPEIVVGIVDGLPDLDHPSLQSAAIEVVSSMIPPGVSGPDGHGTAVCSLIFGSGAVDGIAPGCSGLSLPIFFGRGTETRMRPASQLDLARAITFAIERGASIINVSAGQKTSTPEAETHLAQAVARCADERVLLIAAAGNDGCDCLHLPASVASVLAVGALDRDGRPLQSSNWGEPYRENGLLAPGDDLPVAALHGGVSKATGTSFATAVVSGVAAVLLSVARRERYSLDAIDIRKILLETATPCELEGDGACDRHLAGTLDAAAAIATLHRLGAGPQPARRQGTSPILYRAVKPPAVDTFQKHRGESSMSNAAIAPSAAIALEAEGITPSACSCESKHEDELEQQAAIAPQALSPALTRPSPPLVPNELAKGLIQQGCSCAGNTPPQIVYALGSLWFDFSTEARYDALVQQIGDPVRANNPVELFAFLRANPQHLVGLTFILMQDQIPLYAIQPAGAFALQTYNAMLDALESSLGEEGKEQRISLPGFIAGSTRLLNGMVVPIVVPDLRGMYMWKPKLLLEATMGRSRCRLTASGRRRAQLPQSRLLRTAQSRRCSAGAGREFRSD